MEQCLTRALLLPGMKPASWMCLHYFISWLPVMPRENQVLSPIFWRGLNHILVAGASCNGDFTIEEANTVTAILKSLVAYCQKGQTACKRCSVHQRSDHAR